MTPAAASSITAPHRVGSAVRPSASPGSLSFGEITTPADVLKATIIGPHDDWWEIWLAAAGVKPPYVFERRGVELDTQQMIASVAVAGHGVALVTPGFVADDLKSGRLLQLFDVMGTTGAKYCLVYPESRRSQRKIRMFRDWLLAEAGRRSASLSAAQ